jgi:hypothetical protein
MVDLDQLRRIDLVEVMTALGLQPIERYSGTCEYRLADGRKLAVTPRPWKAGVNVGLFQCWNGETVAGRRGGAGAIDLVMAVRGCTLRAALRFLSERRPGSMPVDARRLSVDDPTPLFQRRSLPEAAPGALKAVRRYLIAQRGLPALLVDSLIAAKLISTLTASTRRAEALRTRSSLCVLMPPSRFRLVQCFEAVTMA